MLHQEPPGQTRSGPVRSACHFDSEYFDLGRIRVDPLVEFLNIFNVTNILGTTPLTIGTSGRCWRPRWSRTALFEQAFDDRRRHVRQCGQLFLRSGVQIDRPLPTRAMAGEHPARCEADPDVALRWISPSALRADLA